MTEPAVHPAALPNTLSADELRLRPGPDGVNVAIDPASAGWRYLSYRAAGLSEGEQITAGGEGREAVVVLIGGGGVRVEPEGSAAIDLVGRIGPFEEPPWAAYLPPGRQARVTGRPRDGPTVTLGIAEAPASGRSDASPEPLRISPTDVSVEVRGAGSATRQINHIVTPEFPADRLLVVEVLTPSGNWSSWPPHKHDVDDMPNEAVLEEIYHYQLRRPEGWGIQRLYQSDGSRDAFWAVRHGDVVLVPDGYHPFAAAHGYDAYYLNALAGDRRTMACSFDPELDWIREGWKGMDPDPRVPLVR
jgi:5-deoxy-glucuronate isomerase